MIQVLIEDSQSKSENKILLAFEQFHFLSLFLMSEKQNICQLFMVSVMRYLLVIAGTLCALSTVTVVVIVATKQCTESMVKPQRRDAYHYGDMKACQQSVLCGRDLQHTTVYIPLSNSPSTY